MDVCAAERCAIARPASRAGVCSWWTSREAPIVGRQPSARPAARGRLRLRAVRRGGRHTIRATVLNASGVPTGVTLRVASYKLRPQRPPRPRHVRIARKGSALVVRWRGPARARYEATVRIGDGRKLRLLSVSRRHRVRIPIVPRGVRVRVALVTRSRTGRTSHASLARA